MLMKVSPALNKVGKSDIIKSHEGAGRNWQAVSSKEAEYEYFYQF